MADYEDYFPRGGKKPTTSYFKQNENFLGAAVKGDRKKRKLKKKSENDDGYLSDDFVQEVDNSFKNCGIWLNYKVVKEGQLLLGRIRQVHETKIHIALPCRMSGIVMACHISEAYNKILEAYVNDQVDKVCELSQMFRPGQYVAVKVLEVASNNLMLSMMPQHINSGRMHKDLQKGILLQAAVSSVEDHGYVMDIGIPNTRAFLPKDSANPEIELESGVLTWVTIKSLSPSTNSSVLTLSSELAALQKAVQRIKTTALLPATALEFTVDRPLDNGIEGHILDKTTAYIQRNHVESVKGKKPGLGHKIRARVLYEVPPNNTPFLTMKAIFDTTYPDLTQERKLNDGDIVEGAQVIKIVGRSIHFKLGEGSIGILSLRRVTVHEDLTDEQVLVNSYPIGSTHKVRVLCYNLSDYVYSVSDDPTVLGEKYFMLSQLSVGDVVIGTVSSVADNHLKIAVGRVSGTVPQMHMTETGIFVDPKKASNSKLPKKKFKVGQEVKARVLTLDLIKQHMLLTLKPSLLDPEIEILQSYEQAGVGKAYTGIIAHIKDYLLITFFNNVTAFVPKKFVSAEPVDNLADAFHLGQIVKCTIMFVDPESKKMHGSLTMAPFTPSENRKQRTKRKIDNQEVPAKEPNTDDHESKTKKRKKDVKEKEEAVNEEPQENKKKKKRKDKETTEEQAVNEEPQENRKNEKRKDKEITKEQIDERKEDVEVEESRKKKKKDKKVEGHATDVSLDDNSVETTTNDEQNDKDRKNKKNKHNDIKEADIKQKEDSEESDAIETDIYEDGDQVLTPQDLSLIDLSDCITAKNCKKRVVALLKCIRARTKRIDRIDKKIANIEHKGLSARNKKFHTAMQAEKMANETRIKKLLETLEIAQEKLKTFGIEISKDNKKEKEKVAPVQNNNTNRKNKTDVREEKHKEHVEKLKEVKVLNSLKPAVEIPSVKDFWSLDTDVIVDKGKEEETSSSEEEEEEKPKKKRKKLTVAEKAAKAREEEERIREMEKRAIESENAPRSSDQFERALLAQPDCSQLWIAYMAFHLQATEIEKARAVGRKALNIINFREEGEKLNVWLALLNLEHRFGTKETQQKTLEDALQMNDTYKIHSKLLDILVDTSKQQDLVSLVELMMRKYRRQPDVYKACGEACFKAGLVEKARQVMQKGIAALEKKEHVSLLVRFASLERAAGARERCEALLEQVLGVYPQRVDVCCAYLDLLLKDQDVDRVRQVMERMTSLQLPARKMKVLYKKWIEVEEKIGDETHVENIRRRALEFVDKAKF